GAGTGGGGGGRATVGGGGGTKYMYGEGFTWRSTRYTSNGSTYASMSKRCASTTWKMSPARMCSRAASTAAWYSALGIVERNGGGAASASGGGGGGEVGRGRASVAACASRRAAAAR